MCHRHKTDKVGDVCSLKEFLKNNNKKTQQQNYFENNNY